MEFSRNYEKQPTDSQGKKKSMRKGETKVRALLETLVVWSLSPISREVTKTLEPHGIPIPILVVVVWAATLQTCDIEMEAF